MQGYVILVRHGQSAENRDNVFTGWRNPGLIAEGRREARGTGRTLLERGLIPDVCHTSALKRTHQTLDLMLEAMKVSDITIRRSSALNERDYGELTGLNRDAACARWGDEQVHRWRRSYDAIVPGGESLKMTCDRVWPYYDSRIAPELMRGKTVIVVGHGNSLRALVMKLENLSPQEIELREFTTGVPVIYSCDSGGNVAPWGLADQHDPIPARS